MIRKQSSPPPPPGAAPWRGVFGPLAWAHSAFLRMARLGHGHFPESVNPFTQLGALANVNFIIALATGVLLLFWYKPSVHEAYASVKAMEASPFLAGLIQSLHRYSSDACVLFAVVHGLEALLARRFQRPRWLAWVTGLLLMAGLWAEGWIGYWLVWDDRALAIAAGTARVLDVLPIFEEPLSRSFLTRDNLSSLFFFVVFFIHMLVPLAFALGLWLHIARLNRPKFLTDRSASAAMLAALVLLSLVWPARAGMPADPSLPGVRSELDLYYMLPLLLEGKAHASLYVAFFAAAACVLLLLPFLKGRAAAAKPVVEPAKCTGCNRCYEDCPFNAISMVADETGKLKAVIDEDACLACGNCVGACNPHAVDFRDFPVDGAEEKVKAWFGGGSGGPRLLAFLCGNSAAAGLRPDPETGLCTELPGYRAITVPCSGWILPRVLELAAREGAAGCLIAGCGPGTPTHRLGTDWTLQRLMGKRLPSLSIRRIGDMPVEYAQFNRPEARDLLAAAAAFRGRMEGPVPAPARNPGLSVGERRPRGPGFRLAVQVSALAALLLILAAGSRVPHVPGIRSQAQLVVSFKHAAGHVKVIRKDKSEEEKLLPHMRGGQQMARERRSIRLRVTVDGQPAGDQVFPPRGLFGDGAGSGIMAVDLPPGRHAVGVSLVEVDPSGQAAEGGEGGKDSPPSFSDTREIDFEAGRRTVVLFQGKEGFRWR